MCRPDHTAHPRKAEFQDTGQQYIPLFISESKLWCNGEALLELLFPCGAFVDASIAAIFLPVQHVTRGQELPQ